jgi:hypothetical protein
MPTFENVPYALFGYLTCILKDKKYAKLLKHIEYSIVQGGDQQPGIDVDTIGGTQLCAALEAILSVKQAEDKYAYICVFLKLFGEWPYDVVNSVDQPIMVDAILKSMSTLEDGRLVKYTRKTLEVFTGKITAVDSAFIELCLWLRGLKAAMRSTALTRIYHKIEVPIKEKCVVLAGGLTLAECEQLLAMATKPTSLSIDEAMWLLDKLGHNDAVLLVFIPSFPTFEKRDGLLGRVGGNALTIFDRLYLLTTLVPASSPKVGSKRQRILEEPNAAQSSTSQ